MHNIYDKNSKETPLLHCMSTPPPNHFTVKARYVRSDKYSDTESLWFSPLQASNSGHSFTLRSVKALFSFQQMRPLSLRVCLLSDKQHVPTMAHHHVRTFLRTRIISRGFLF